MSLMSKRSRPQNPNACKSKHILHPSTETKRMLLTYLTVVDVKTGSQEFDPVDHPPDR